VSIIEKDFTEELAKITPEDKVLFFGVETLKDLRIMEQEIAACRMSLFFWNTVESRYKGYLQIRDFKSFIRTTRMALYTFDPGDAQQYGLRLTNQVYRYPDSSLSEIKPQSDVFFVGMDKQRSGELARIVTLLREAGAILDFHILKDKRTTEIPALVDYYVEKGLPYEETLKKIHQSHCMLEVVQKRQTGLTLRSLEALFHGKKLLTNNPAIKDSDFYRPENIMVIDANTKASDIASFLQAELIPISDELKAQYDIKAWIQEFI
jgi:hypothetical protein